MTERRSLCVLALAVAIGLFGAAWPGAPRDVARAQTTPAPVTGPRAGFSPGAGVFNASDAELARDLDAMVAAGGGWVRFDFPWSSVEPSAPLLDPILGLLGVKIHSFDWRRVDRLVDAAHARGLHVIALPFHTPEWARPPGTNDKHPPTDVAAYTAFVRAAVERYAPKGVKVWEIWNEPNLSNFWSPKPDALVYTSLLTASAIAIRAADPTATVVSGGLSPAIDATDGSQISPKTFLERIYAAGGGGSFDAVGMHPYSYPARPLDPASASWNTFYRLPLIRDVMVANGDGAKQVWSTEFGAPTGTSPQSVSEAEQAAMVTDGYDATRQWDWHGPLLWYSARDAGTDLNDREQNFGLLHIDFSPKPSFMAYREANARLDARYTPLTPSRILDTRSGNGAPVARLGPGATLDLQVTGRGGVPSSGVSAVVMNLTVTQTTASSFLTAWPTGLVRPGTVSVSYGANQTVAGLVVAKLGAGGRVSLYNASGETHVIADVVGWYSDGTGSSGAGYNPLSPSRILDTRSGNGAPAAKLGPGATLGLQVTGRGGVPSSGVSAVIMNLTVTEPTGYSFLTAWPAGQARPTASNLNFVPNQTVPNLVVVKVGAGGKASLYNNGGSTHVLADVVGWYGADGAAGAMYTPLVPDRILDTRSGNGAPAAPLGQAATLGLQVTGRGGVPATGVSAVVMNLTVTEPTGYSFLTAWPAGQARPTASNLNFVPRLTVSNSVVVRVGAGGKVSLYNNGGQAHVIADVVGWYGQ